MDNFVLPERSYLRSGDVVDIVAPSSKCHPIVLERIKELLNSWGLQCYIPNDIFGDNILCANTDEKRFEHLKYALLNNTSKAVWCLLGGYGSTKIIPMLSSLPVPSHQKIFIGFSDITALHIFLQGRWGWPTIHGPSGYQVSLNKVSNDSINILRDILFKKEQVFLYEQIVPLNNQAKNNLRIHSPIIGGNLHLIQASLGTSWQINADNKILFMEEVNEKAYRVDRVLTHLNQARIFDRAKAILFGDIIDKGEPDGKFIIMKVIEEFSHRFSLPILKINNIGHGNINNPILFGNCVELSVGENSYLKFR